MRELSKNLLEKALINLALMNVTLRHLFRQAQMHPHRQHADI